jgi:subtilisin family serine protease
MKAVHRCTAGLLALVLFAAPGTADVNDPAPAGPPDITRVSFDGQTYTLSLHAAAFHVTTNEVQDERLVQVSGSSALLILWNEVSPDGATLPFYAISRDGRTIARVRRTSYLLKVRHGDFDPLVAVNPVEAALAAGADCNLYIVQFVTQPLEAFRTRIEELGGTVRRFVANHAHIVEMAPAIRDAVAALPFVRWVGPYHPAYRLEELMRDNLARADELFPSQRYNIMVFEAGLKQKHIVADAIRTIGGAVDRTDAGKYLLEATLTPDQLLEVVRWDQVVFVDRWSPYEKDMDIVREIGGANHIETVAGYTGAGVRGEAFDAGCNTSHPDFASRPLIRHGTVGVDAHGTATAGVCFGDGTGDPRARGLMPDGQGIVADYN